MTSLALLKLLQSPITRREATHTSKNQPLSYSQRAALMEGYLTSWERVSNADLVKSSRIFRDLESRQAHVGHKDDGEKILQCKEQSCERVVKGRSWVIYPGLEALRIGLLYRAGSGGEALQIGVWTLAY